LALKQQEEVRMEKTGVPEGMGYLIIDVVAVVVLIAAPRETNQTSPGGGPRISLSMSP